jgi:hypothetical protein
LYNSHARPGVQRAPSLARALSQERSEVPASFVRIAPREGEDVSSFQDGPQDQTSDVQLRIGESWDSQVRDCAP